MQNQNDKRKFWFIVTLFALLVANIIIWGLLNYLKTNSIKDAGVIIVALIIAVFGIKMIKDKYRSLTWGEPLKDERSRKLEIKAAAYAFYIGIYWLLGLSMAIEYYNLGIPAGSVANVGIAGQAVIFGLSYWYLSKRGE